MMDNQFSTDETKVDVCVRDFLGIKSNTLQLNREGEFQIEYKLNTAWLICTSLMLILTFIFIAMIGIPSVRQVMGNHTISASFLLGAWVIYIGATFLFFKNKLYILALK